jgi:hypothetical protein
MISAWCRCMFYDLIKSLSSMILYKMLVIHNNLNYSSSVVVLQYGHSVG